MPSAPGPAFTVSDIASASGTHRSSVKRRAAREKWVFTERPVRGGRQRLYALQDLPKQIQAALVIQPAKPVSSAPVSPCSGAALPAVDVKPSTAGPFEHATSEDQAALSESRWRVFESAPATMQAEAKRRHDAVLAVDRLASADGNVELALSMVANLRDDVSRSSLSRWWYETLRMGKPIAQQVPRADWLAALITKHRGRSKTADCDPRAWDWYKGQFLNRKQPSHRDTYRRLEKLAAKQNWQIPSEATLRRRLDQEVGKLQKTLMREGTEALARRLPAQTRDRSHFAAGEAVNGDGLKFDKLWVKFPDGEILNTTTAWLWQDLRTGRILAHRAGKTENTDLFRLATYDATAEAAFSMAYVDNTRVAANKLMTAGAENRHRFRADPQDGLGLLLQLGITPKFTNPDKATGNPGAKPIERAFGIGGIHSMVATHPRFVDRGFSKKTAISFEEFTEVLAEEVARFNAQEGRRTRACNGVLSYDQAWDEAIAQCPPRKLTESQRRLLLLNREVVTVNRQTGMVRIKAGRSRLGVNEYWTEALMRHAGERVCVMFDPENLTADAAIYSLEGHYLCEAQHRPTQAFDNVEAGRETAKFKRRLVKATRLAADAQTRMDALERAALHDQVSGQKPPPKTRPKPAGKVVQGHFKKTPDPERDRDAVALPAAANGDSVDDRFIKRMKQIAEVHDKKIRI